MSQSPIEFLGEGEAHEVPSSEYTGADGLIQPSRADVNLRAADGMEIGHDLTPSERAQIMSRRARVPLQGSEQYGEALDELIVDPHTGRVFDDDDATLDVTGASGREHGLAEGVWQ